MTLPRLAPRLAVVGAGRRGLGYASLAAEAGAVIVAVAEPDDARRDLFAGRFDIPPARRASSWESFDVAPGDVDGVVIATMDDLHVDPALRFAQLGVPILLEKPIARTWADCLRLRDNLPAAPPPILVAHVLRYAPYTRLLRRLVEDGAVGEIMNVHHIEPVGFWHFAHSFARGNWRSGAEAAPFVVAKACHDVDWVTHLVPSACVAVSSFGALNHFRPENRPAGAADRCLDCTVDCVYDARSIYLEPASAGDYSFPVSAVTSEQSVTAVRAALEQGNYGRCVYTCDNDVMDTQVASLLFEDGRTATITVSAFTEFRSRHSVVSGTLGEATVTGAGVEVYSFGDRRRRFHTAAATGTGIARGHAGGDAALVDAFLGEITSPTEGGAAALSDALASHSVAFAIEEARLRRAVLDPRDFLGTIGDTRLRLR